MVDYESKTYEVIVGNIGRVYHGDSYIAAQSVFNDYRELARLDMGRASGESVVLFEDGEILLEHEGQSE